MPFRQECIFIVSLHQQGADLSHKYGFYSIFLVVSEMSPLIVLWVTSQSGSIFQQSWKKEKLKWLNFSGIFGQIQ